MRGNKEVFQLNKVWVSFVLGVKNPQTKVHSWCIHFHPRWTPLKKFCISNSVTTVSFGRATSVRHSPFAILSDSLFWNSCILTCRLLSAFCQPVMGMHAMGMPFSHHQWCHCIVRVFVKTSEKSPSLYDDQKAKPRTSSTSRLESNALILS